ncbi:MAG: hypothetical protein HUU20_09660 [Pirellulales bacterium]|nr:hypothetical protein [Pirellulales bacterium]
MSAEERDVKPAELPPALKSLEAALASLVPRTPSLDRDRLMFEAGRQAAVRSQAGPVCRWAWPTLAAATMAAALLVVLLVRPAAPGADRIVYVPVDPQPARLTPGSLPNETPDRRGSEPKGAVQAMAPMFDIPARAAVAGAPHAPAPYFDLRDCLLSREPQLWRLPGQNSAGSGLPTEPASYAELRDELLRGSASG